MTYRTDPQSRSPRPHTGPMWQCFHCETFNDPTADSCWKCDTPERADALDEAAAARLAHCYALTNC